MRLKTRILITASALLIAAVTICCIMILCIVHNQLKNEAMITAKNEFAEEYFIIPTAVFSNQEQMIDNSYMLFFVRSSKLSNELTLSCNDRYLMNNFGFAPEPYLFKEDSESLTRSCYCRVFGTLYLLVGQQINFHEKDYSICLVRNMSKLDKSVHQLALYCLLIGASITIVFLLLIYLFLSLSLKPIRMLQSGARDIASGNYSARIEVRYKDEIGQLAEDFNLMAQAVEESIASLTEQNIRKQQFINDLSHEMKTPVTSLLINSETLITRSVSEADTQRALYRIHEQSKWIERLSQKLMTLVLLQNKIELFPHPVSALFASVEDCVQDSLSRSGIKLMIHPDSSVVPMDFDLMQSALVNLIENAIKASQRGSTVELYMTDHAIAVRDYGCGIPTNEISRITEPFYMVDRSRSKKLGGSGLGLALVQQIAAVHHAKLQIESEFMKGTAIFFRFYDAV